MTELPKLIETKIAKYLYDEVDSLLELEDFLKAGQRDRLIFKQYGVLHRVRPYYVPYNYPLNPQIDPESNKYVPLDKPRILNYHFENVDSVIDLYPGLRFDGEDISDPLALYNRDYQIAIGTLEDQRYFFVILQEIYGRSRTELACRVFYSHLAPSKNIEKPVLPYKVRRVLWDYARDIYRFKYLYLGAIVGGLIVGKCLRYGMDWYKKIDKLIK